MFSLLAQNDANKTIEELNSLNEFNQTGDYANVGIGKALAAAAPNVSFDLGLTITRAAQLALLIAGVLLFVYLVLGGLQWIMSGGDKGKVENARNMITQAIIGLAVVSSSFAIFLVLQYFFGLEIVQV